MGRVENKVREMFNVEGDKSPYTISGTRIDMATLFAQLGYTTGAEIGVLNGNYSIVLCREIPNLKLYCVDPWSDWRQIRNPIPKMESAYQHCKKRLSQYNVELLRMASSAAAPMVPDDSLDFVYIDGLHDYDNVSLDIKLWYPKVRVGGVVSGHDYIDFPVLGVIQAVKEFVERHNIESYFISSVYSTARNLSERMPSWFWEKV